MLNSLLKIALFLTIVPAFTGTCFSQEDSYASVAEIIPQPIGGMNAIYKHINYPKAAKIAGVSGKVYILAYINENGNVDDTKIVKSLGYGCDEEVINAVKSWKFTPGENNGIRIKTKLILAFTFKE
jgi:protein TonB